jgi:hypothetical protein
MDLPTRRSIHWSSRLQLPEASVPCSSSVIGDMSFPINKNMILNYFDCRMLHVLRIRVSILPTKLGYVLAPLLAASSALIGHARWAHQAWKAWKEPPHLWCAAVAAVTAKEVSRFCSRPASAPDRLVLLAESWRFGHGCVMNWAHGPLSACKSVPPVVAQDLNLP